MERGLLQTEAKHTKRKKPSDPIIAASDEHEFYQALSAGERHIRIQTHLDMRVVNPEFTTHVAFAQNTTKSIKVCVFVTPFQKYHGPKHIEYATVMSSGLVLAAHRYTLQAHDCQVGCSTHAVNHVKQCS